MTPGGVVALGVAAIAVGGLVYGISRDVARWWDERAWRRQEQRAKEVISRFERREELAVTDVLVLPSGRRLEVRSMDVPRRLPSFTVCEELWKLPVTSICPPEECV